ncbi:hypothetical protein NT2_16_00020 [Caenibius tardaugens NBRC 16725]|uniref:Peptidase S74 domain-containing protein n=1 Tax=Caenibius tardaugens NBRC 16725 TaxID=1219035 RepID=U2YBZ4_9SPHN|nr:tail fiber domain-containing protein [Caenibius tardaugens]AZI37873.1 hypothetical protein EGO55_19480 [Caenibius tardaugens NBRC 16725]GAD51066.1 hypothetical protein NT2_16_00020 [Caenibius tardaugens NBRC 16725]
MKFEFELDFIALIFLIVAALGFVGMALCQKKFTPPKPRDPSERGSIFMALFGAVALVAILGSAIMAYMNGPLRNSIFLTNRNIANTQMTVAAQMAVAAAAAQANSGDCDGDGIIEPLPWRAKGAGEPDPPTGGGFIPSQVGTSKSDPWGGPYGYCVWDHGSKIGDAACGGPSQNRLAGADSDGFATVAIISSGPDRTFQTTCSAFKDTSPHDGLPDTDLVAKDAGSDDLITVYTYREAVGASSGLWQLKSGDANTATIGSKDIEVGGNANFAGQVITDSLNSRSGLLSVNDPLRLPDETEFPTCTADLVGAIRRYQGAVEICGVDSGSNYAFLPVGGGSGGGSGSLNDLSDVVADYDDFENMFLGDGAGRVNATGEGNTALGIDALYNNTSGGWNISIGYTSLDRNTTGSENVAVGTNALHDNTTGNYNVAVGSNALWYGTVSNNTAVGYSALKVNTTGTSNAAVGYQALSKNTTASGNTALGSQALQNSTTGSANTAVGTSTLQNNTTGMSNTAVGTNALYSTKTGGYNVALGNQALFNNTTGTNNTALGYQALYTSTTSTGNTAVGYQALTLANFNSYNTASYNTAVGNLTLSKNTWGEGNTAVGNTALQNNTTGFHNTALGFEALKSTTGASDSTAVGYQALSSYKDGYAYSTAVGARALANANNGGFNTAVGSHALEQTTTGTNNTAVGVDAAASNTEGGGNTAIGMWALTTNTTGASNTVLGLDALSSNTTGSYNVSVGRGSMGSNTEGSFNTVVGNSAGGSGGDNVAVGYSALAGSGDRNIAVGIWALESNSTGYGNVGVGYAALDTNTTGSNNTALGYFADVSSANLTNATAIGNDAKATASNSIVLGNSDITKIYAKVTSITAISDRRLKRDIGDLGLGLDFLRKLRPVQYRFNNGDDTLRYGFIAQEVEAALPASLQRKVEESAPGKELALLNRQADERRTYRLSYGELTAPLVKAVQQLAANDDQTAKEIATLKGEIAALREAQRSCTGR